MAPTREKKSQVYEHTANDCCRPPPHAPTTMSNARSTTNTHTPDMRFAALDCRSCAEILNSKCCVQQEQTTGSCVLCCAARHMPKAKHSPTPHPALLSSWRTDTVTASSVRMCCVVHTQSWNGGGKIWCKIMYTTEVGIKLSDSNSLCSARRQGTATARHTDRHHATGCPQLMPLGTRQQQGSHSAWTVNKTGINWVGPETSR